MSGTTLAEETSCDDADDAAGKVAEAGVGDAALKSMSTEMGLPLGNPGAVAFAPSLLAARARTLQRGTGQIFACFAHRRA